MCDFNFVLLILPFQVTYCNNQLVQYTDMSKTRVSVCLKINTHFNCVDSKLDIFGEVN
jgi:hypothetical protein